MGLMIRVARRLKKKGDTESPMNPVGGTIFGKRLKSSYQGPLRELAERANVRGLRLKKASETPQDLSPEEFFKRHSINLPVDEQEAKKRMARTGKKTGPSSAGL